VRQDAWGGPVDAGAHAAVARLLADARDGVVGIVEAGHPVLRRPAEPYAGQVGDLLPALLDVMRATMRAAPGVGLAAPQIGLSLAIAVLEDPGMPAGMEEAADARERTVLPPRVLVNPSYERVGAEDRSFYEGCLSVPGYQGVVRRPRAVRLRGQDEEGRELDEVLTGWPARIVQHETDHLAGVLYVDSVETRSLSTNAMYARAWAGEATPRSAAGALGFRLDD
jgi:peptide deformylase